MFDPEPKTGVAQPKTLRKQSVLRKICYIRYGAASEADLASLRRDLLSFRKEVGDTSISRQAIASWFLAKFPYRQKSLFFLLKYLDARVDRDHLEKRRAEAYGEVSQRIRNQIGVSPGYENLIRNTRRIYINNRGQLNIDLLDNMIVVRQIRKQLEGVYLVYHSRLTEDYRGQFTQEVMRIAWNKGELEFELWYFREGVDVQKYNGVIFVYGNIIWFLCSANSQPDRIRVMNFRAIESISDKYADMRVGLMLSDIPVPNLNDPVSCRVLMLRVKPAPDNVYQFAKQKVRNFESSELRAGSSPEEREIGRLITTLIDNKRTASSDSGSINLAKDLEGGGELKDHLLKVDQTTINKFAERISLLSESSVRSESAQVLPKNA